MEPVLPEPHVVVVGKSPAVKTLVKLLAAMDWRATVVADADDAAAFDNAGAFDNAAAFDNAGASESARGLPPTAGIVTSVGDMGTIGIDDTTAVVVATQGHYDEPALEAALASPAPYIGLVASATRAETVLGYLRDRGFGDEELRRIHTPAGIDLGHIEHREIAVSVLAQLVAMRASGGIGGPPTGRSAQEAAPTALDPVCGMTVDVDGARFVSVYGGETFYFCCPACKKMFEEQPAEYAGA